MSQSKTAGSACPRCQRRRFGAEAPIAARLLTAAVAIPVLLVAILWSNPIAVWGLIYGATFIVVFSTLVDVAYAYLDPRIRLT